MKINEYDLDALFEEEREIPEVWLIPKKELEGIQNDIIDDDSYRFTVEGPAGSGKTVLATYKFMDLISLNKSNESCLVVYTLALREFIKCGLENTIQKYGTNVKIDNLNIYNVDDNEFTNKINNKKIKYILIDEAQDIKPEVLDNIYKNVENIVIFGDDGQKLYNDGISMEEAKVLISDKMNKNYKIDKHYRVSEAITKFASSIVDKKELVKMSANNRINYKPKVIKCKDFHHELLTVKNIIDELALKSVGIFVNENKSVIEAQKYFEQIGFNCRCKIDTSVEELNFNDVDTPTILVYHSSKGLQFENVFVICCDNQRVYATIDNDELNYRNALFVACTRATKRLFVSYVNELNDFMKDIDSSLYITG